MDRRGGGCSKGGEQIGLALECLAELDLQLHELWLTRKMTVVFVTHSINEAAFLAQRAIVLTRRPARVVLDQRINLPERRTAELRVEPQFARAMRSLFEALEQGQGSAA